MDLWERLTLTALEYLAERLDLSLRNLENGGFLSPEQRAIHLSQQKQAALFVKKAANLNALRHRPALQERLLLLAGVLDGKIIEMPKSFNQAIYPPKRG